MNRMENTMKPHTGSTLMGLAALIAAGITAQAQYTFTTLDAPLGTQGTFADGIQGDKIVGVYYDGSGNGHGFIYRIHLKTWTTLDDPLAVGQSANFDISGNDIIGPYLDSQNNWHSFLYNGRTWTTLDYRLAAPGPNGGTWASGNQDNNIVGYYVDGSGVSHGFLYGINDGAWITFDDPLAGRAAAQGTLAQAIHGGNIVGYYFDSNGVHHGFIYDGSTWSNFDVSQAGGYPEFS